MQAMIGVHALLTGAGKTTLLDILSGHKLDRGVSGEVRVNGKRCGATELRQLSG